jgi:hypothetical protein
MAKGGFKGPKSNAAMIATGIAIVVLIFIVYASFFMVPASSDHRVLLVANDVLAQAGGPERFATYLSNQSVAVVPYNYDSVATYAELGDLVGAHMASTGATRVRSVGIMYHTPNTYNLKCFKSDPEKSTGSGSLESFELFRRFVVALRVAYGVEDVDLISCAVVSAERNVLSALDFNGARVNASTNTTGQVKQGPVGDWVLEAGNVNLIGRYFNASITTADLALAFLDSKGEPYVYVHGSPASQHKVREYIDLNPGLTPAEILNGPKSVWNGAHAANDSVVQRRDINTYREWRRKNPSANRSTSPWVGYVLKFQKGAGGVGIIQR